MNPNQIVLPELVDKWVGPIQFALYTLIAIWVVLYILSYLKRRAYNLTSVETAASRDVKPGFLKVDHAAREDMIEAGKEFGKTDEVPYKSPLSFARICAVFASLVSLGSAVVFSVMRIESVEAVWQKYSAWDRFVAIVSEHPVGFTFSIILIVGALIRFALELRNTARAR